MNNKPLSLVILAVQFFLMSSSKADLAYVDAFGERGQAYLFSLGAQCYGLVPTHVIESSGGFVSGVVNNIPPITVEGRTLGKFGYDTSVIQVSGHNRGQCGDSYSFQGQSLDTLLSSNVSTGFLKYVSEDGTTLTVPVVINDVSLTHLFVKPSNPSDKILKGFSGSSLFIKDRYAGMLLSIQEDGVTGNVLRSDRAFETVKPLFLGKLPSNANVLSEPSSEGQASLDYDIVSWTSKAANPNSSVQNIKNLTPGHAWEFIPQKKRSELIIAFKQPTQITSISLVTSDKVGDSSALRKVEILGRKSEGNWRTIRGGELPNQGTQHVTFTTVPKTIKQLKFKFYSNYGAQTYRLGGIIVQ